MKFSKSSPVNIEAVLKLTILLGFALFFYSTISSGTVRLYVHPRLVSYMKFGIAAMVLIALFIVRDVFKPKRKVNLALSVFYRSAVYSVCIACSFVSTDSI